MAKALCLSSIRVEQITALDFFYLMPDDQEASLEAEGNINE
ncbi:hypothetical protein ES705_38216 [subsurface metagenome]